MDFGDAQKESIDMASDAAYLKGAENRPISLQNNVVELMISHKKPKSNANLNITTQGICSFISRDFLLHNVFIQVFWLIFYTNLVQCCYACADYVCTRRDITFIEAIMSAPKKTKFVDIGDALLSNDDLECLMRDDMFLHDGVRLIASRWT